MCSGRKAEVVRLMLDDKQTGSAVAAWRNPGQRSVRAHTTLASSLASHRPTECSEVQTIEEPLKEPLSQELDVSELVVDASYRFSNGTPVVKSHQFC